MRLIIAMYFRVEARETHEKRRAGAGMTEDEELIAREELPDLCHFLRRDDRDGIAFFIFWFTLKQDAGSRLKTREHDLLFPIQHDETDETDKDPKNIDP